MFPSINQFLTNKIKGTVSIILSDTKCKDDNAQFTMVPIKALPDQV